MAPKKDKKKKKPLSGKKPPKKKKSTAKGTGPIGPTINQITCTLSFSMDATAVSIGIGTLEQSVASVNVYWNNALIYSTSVWNDPGLTHIACSCTPNMQSSLRIDLNYATGTSSYRKTNIYPTPSGNPTVVLSKI